MVIPSDESVCIVIKAKEFSVFGFTSCQPLLIEWILLFIDCPGVED